MFRSGNRCCREDMPGTGRVPIRGLHLFGAGYFQRVRLSGHSARTWTARACSLGVSFTGGHWAANIAYTNGPLRGQSCRADRCITTSNTAKAEKSLGTPEDLLNLFARAPQFTALIRGRNVCLGPRLS